MVITCPCCEVRAGMLEQNKIMSGKKAVDKEKLKHDLNALQVYGVVVVLKNVKTMLIVTI